MSRLNALILKSFLPPFITTFFIAWFVFLMQFLWYFMEKIAGKGLSFDLVMELIGYRSVALFPLAIPIATLVAGVMVIGGLAEHYELAAVHSAGKGLKHILAPLAVAGLVLAGASYLTSDYLIPAANLQFLQRISDVQRKKPNLSIETGVFNEDLDNYNVYAAQRDPSSGDLLDIRLYDQQGYISDPKVNQIVAARGSFSSGNTESELILTLHDGHHLREKTSRTIGGEFTRTEFKTYQLSFDLSQFDLKQATDLANSDHYALLPTWELQRAADSIQDILETDRIVLSAAATQNLPFARSSSTESISGNQPPSKKPKVGRETQTTRPLLPLTGIPTALDQVTPQRRKQVLLRARNKVRGLQRQAKTVVSNASQQREPYERYRFERHGKFGLAATCLFFVLIGGSAGAVVRKGGFGYPLLIGISCFAFYILILQFCQRLMKAGALTGPVAAWIPVMVLALILVVVYWRAGLR